MNATAAQDVAGIAPIAGLPELARHWRLGTWRSLEPMLHGLNNESFLLETDLGRFVVRRSRASKSEDDIRFEHALNRHLREDGIPVPPIVPGAAGATWRFAGGRLWSVAEFIPSEPALAADRPAHQAGTLLAAFHGSVERFSPPVAIPPPRSKVDEALRAFADLPPLDEASLTLARRIRQTLRECAAAEKTWCGRLGIGIVHGGCRLTAVLFRGGRVVALLDLDSSREGPRVQDLAISLASFAKPRPGQAVSPSSALAFMNAYRAHASPSESELHALPMLLAGVLLRQSLADLARYATHPAEAVRLEKAEIKLHAAQISLTRPEALAGLLCDPAPGARQPHTFAGPLPALALARSRSGWPHQPETEGDEG